MQWIPCDYIKLSSAKTKGQVIYEAFIYQVQGFILPKCYGCCWAAVRERGRGRWALPCYSTRGYCSRVGSWRRLGLQGRWKRRLRGFAPGRQERRGFLLISCSLRLIHLLSLYREVYLTPKQSVYKCCTMKTNG